MKKSSGSYPRVRVESDGRGVFGHHPFVAFVAFVDHGQAGSGEPVAALLRPGNAGSNTATDHIEITRLVLAQLPGRLRRRRQTLIRADPAGGTHAFLDWHSGRGRWLSHSVGITITDAIHQAVLKIPKKAWMPAYDAKGTERPGAWVAEITDMPDHADSLTEVEQLRLKAVLAHCPELDALTGHVRSFAQILTEH